MKARLIAIALLLGGLGAGSYFVGWNSGEVDSTLLDSFGALESYDKSQCVVSACNTAQCDAARRHLDDAGFQDAILREVECPFRIGQRARDLAADAGFALGSAKYQMLKMVAMRRPAAGGGFAFGVAVDDNGWPVEAVATSAFPCAWKPSAGATCTRVDGGNPGVENTMQAGQWAGAGCVRKACTEVAGDSSAP